VHLIYDSQQQAEGYGKASSFHKAFDPMAVSYNGTLYVIGYNTTEPDVMYFRADKMAHAKAAETTGESTQAMLNKYIGSATVGLFVVVLGALLLSRKKE
jgi:hypothetical protein